MRTRKLSTETVNRIADSLRIPLGKAQMIRRLVRKVQCPKDFEAAQNWLEHAYHDPADHELIMHAIGEILEGIGIERLPIDRDDTEFVFVSVGSRYGKTVFFDKEKGKYFVASVDDILSH